MPDLADGLMDRVKRNLDSEQMKEFSERLRRGELVAFGENRQDVQERLVVLAELP
jgi:hypothetical protein